MLEWRSLASLLSGSRNFALVRGWDCSEDGMLPRRVFQTKPGAGSNLRAEVTNTDPSTSSSKSWRIQEVCAERILDTARTSSTQSTEELLIPQPVKVSRQVSSSYEISWSFPNQECEQSRL